MKKLLAATALTLTLALSGAAYAHGDWHGGNDHKDHPRFMEQALAKLPEKDADQFRDTMKKAHEKNKALIEHMHKLREERLAILTAPDFDKKDWLAKGDSLMKFRKDMHQKMRANMQEAFATALAELPQDERKTLASAMEEMRHKHQQQDHNGDDHSDGKPN